MSVRVLAAMICGTVAGTLLASSLAHVFLFPDPVVALGTGVGGLLAVAGGLLVAGPCRGGTE